MSGQLPTHALDEVTHGEVYVPDGLNVGVQGFNPHEELSPNEFALEEDPDANVSTASLPEPPDEDEASPNEASADEEDED